MLIDTHSHLNFAAFDKDREEVIKRCLDNDIWMINVGTNFETSKKVVEIAERYGKGVYAAIGLHPINLDTGLVKIKVDELEGEYFEREFNFKKYKDLAQSEKVIAIGEIGLDYWRRPKTKKKLAEFKQKQKDLFLKEIKLAQELNLPIIFHCRMAHAELFELLNSKFKIQNSKLNGVMHSFVGNSEQLEKYLELGFYIGFNGIIFKKIEGINFEENIKNTPLDKILIETDCPYLTPPGFPEERNNPLGVKFVAEEIAKIKNLSFEEIAKITTENAKKLFKI
ncbi:MAG: TatD family hydrolase [Patescibacteria group bacterium]|nr:TatD family hydrolase [Patescibacteria group bacterium]